jgi:dipeptidyl aminopeptidase B
MQIVPVWDLYAFSKQPILISCIYSASGYVFTNNTSLNKTFGEFETPVIRFSEIESDGYSTSCLPTISKASSYSDFPELNVKEIRPPQMDDSGRTKYPVLFRVYVYQG